MDSPLGDDSDHEGDFSLTPRTEAKYNKIDEEFHLMMQRNQLNGVRVSSLRIQFTYCSLCSLSRIGVLDLLMSVKLFRVRAVGLTRVVSPPCLFLFQSTLTIMTTRC